MPETPEILLKAADVIVERGHHKGDYAGPGGSLTTCSVCVLGAINVATDRPVDADFVSLPGDDDAMQAAMALADYLHLSFGGIEPGDEIAIAVGDRWNDAPERTPEQVTTALRECAAELSGGAS